MKRLENKYLDKYYLSIKEIPVHNWDELHNTGDFKHLSKTGKVCKHAAGIFDKMQDEFIDRFGVSSEFRELQNKLIDRDLMLSRMQDSKDYADQIFVDILEQEIESLQKKPVNKTTLKDSAMWLGVNVPSLKIDLKNISVWDYYEWLETVQKNIITPSKPQNGRV